MRIGPTPISLYANIPSILPQNRIALLLEFGLQELFNSGWVVKWRHRQRDTEPTPFIGYRSHIHDGDFARCDFTERRSPSKRHFRTSREIVSNQHFQGPLAVSPFLECYCISHN